MQLFFIRLVQQLDNERPKWRSDTIFQLDGFSGHTSSATKALLSRLDVPTIISGPYQYSGAAQELVWAHLKRGDLNLNKLKLSKSTYILLLLIVPDFFANVVHIIHEKMREFNKQDVIMFYHHTVLELFKQIALKPI